MEHAEDASDDGTRKVPKTLAVVGHASVGVVANTLAWNTLVWKPLAAQNITLQTLQTEIHNLTMVSNTLAVADTLVWEPLAGELANGDLSAGIEG